jgi:hypothetical protein
MTPNNASSATDAADELRAEYDLDYRQSHPNRFAAEGGRVVAVTLEPDVAEVFDTSESVNRALRSVIAARRDDDPRCARRAGHP